MIPPRILDDEPTPEEARLLRAGRSFRAPEKIRRETAAAVAAATARGSAAGEVASDIGGPRARFQRIGWGPKALVVVLAVGAFAVSRFPGANSAPPTPSVAEPPPAASATTPVAAQAAPVASVPVVTPADLASVAPPKVAAPPPLSAKAPPAPAAKPSAEVDDSEGLAAEIAAIDRVKKELDRKEPDTALVALDDHRRRFRSGALRPEATALRVEALMARGDATAARKLAETFLAENPTSPLAPRVRDLVGAEPRN